jgi:hypothetical protein
MDGQYTNEANVLRRECATLMRQLRTLLEKL